MIQVNMFQDQHLDIWKQALPYLHTRSNDKHTLYCYVYAVELLEHHPEANQQLVLVSILLHDVGWSTVDEDKQLLSFGPNQKYPELQVQHEKEGARIAKEILSNLDFPANFIDAICEIIDGHDTRKDYISLEDALVKDADKLWRYTPFGLETIKDWFGYSETEQLELLAKWLETRFYTETSQAIANGLLRALELQYQESLVQKLINLDGEI